MRRFRSKTKDDLLAIVTLSGQEYNEDVFVAIVLGTLSLFFVLFAGIIILSVYQLSPFLFSVSPYLLSLHSTFPLPTSVCIYLCFHANYNRLAHQFCF